MALIVTAAGCGSGSIEAPSSSGNTPTIKIAIGSNALNYVDYWVAEAEGLFKKHNVRVEIVNSNALAVAPALLTSGQIDLLLSAVGQGVAVAATGKPVSIVYNLYNYSPGGAAFVGGSDITSIEQLRDKGSDCKLATTQRGTGAYAFARQLMRAYDLRCQISALATTALAVNSITSGQADAATLAPADAATVVEKGGHYLLNPATITDQEAAKIVPNPFPALAVMGLAPALQAKSREVENFLAALEEALKEASSGDPGEIAQKISTLTYFPGLSTETMTRSLTPTLAGLPTTSEGGQITEGAWSTALKSFQEDFDLPGFDAADPRFAYAKLIDMSYLDRAKKQ
ncbi:ABC transporter substrate-binding protein [Frankia sp. CNm7]|uniref:ABC transporter substrate-binding protein n=1 Tax=Frankia nepalensis TaxID=1836974 RepID=A0A937UTC1_9ACTN|nr:ABC transporter substrate-binding protein [Frankia nepalensis]MBL7501969.1 ABC transporter substrate-binding protein [Frankia nepalensis]MBL7510599.1 ABC transporter substrate-binding protein [Frankia nepalensis]MBL7517339.1 ABC transporter substrate-binding protein [Frankia nepalensis]MBL7633422.1 ABC transporter substrate-binding protein [Frankia nepalensis]